MNDSLWRWFYSKSNKNFKAFIVLILGPSGLIAIIKAVTPLVKIINNANLFPNEKELNIFLLNLNFILHLIFLFIVLLNSPTWPSLRVKYLKTNLREVMPALGFKNTDELNNQIEAAHHAEKNFLRFWRYFWIDIFLLYVFWSIVQLITNQIHQPAFFSLVDTFFNNLAAAFLFLCYFSLTNITAYKDDDETDSDISDYSTKVYLFLAVLTTIQLICYLLCTTGHLNYDVQKINLVFKALSGFLVFLSMATVVGRLDSKFVNAQFGVIFLLYMYASIQPLFVFFDAPVFSNKMIVVLYIGLILKVFFYLFVVWLMQTKRLYFYFLQIRRVHFEVLHNWNTIKKHI